MTDAEMIAAFRWLIEAADGEDIFRTSDDWDRTNAALERLLAIVGAAQA